jgi:hypothetical protein
MKLIGLSGAARSGKDTVGNYLINEYEFKRYAFADPLKRAASEMFGIPLKDFVDDDKKEVVNEFWGYSPRQIAQLLGTEGGRELFREDIWVKRAEKAWLDHQDYIANFSGGGWVDPAGTDGMVITDVRFPNEAEWIKETGGLLLHIERPGADGKVGQSNHASEAGYPDELKDHIIINDGTLEDLYGLVRKIIEMKVLNE